MKATASRALLLALLCWEVQALAESVAGPVASGAMPPASSYCSNSEPVVGRRRPGVPIDEYKLPACETLDEERMVPWIRPIELGPPVPDRWRIVNEVGINTNLWDPYNAQNPLKGDLPWWGKDWFYSLTAISDSRAEMRGLPAPLFVAVGGGQPGAFGHADVLALTETLIIDNVIYQGNTVFKPPDWQLRFTPVLSFSREHEEFEGAVNSSSEHSNSFVGVQALFVEKHLRTVSDRYDFDSIRIGIQPFSSDFRGFLLQDSPLGVRLFGTRANNVFQYNAAWFRSLEKDADSGLNEFGKLLRNDVFVANLYWQDFPSLGFTSQLTVLHNRNREGGNAGYASNASNTQASLTINPPVARDYDITYAGYSGDGHFGRFNLSTSIYYAYGKQSGALQKSYDEDVRAHFMAAEGSMDFDWLRTRVSVLWASGDEDPADGRAEGFDAIFENPQFAGADSSFVIRQSLPLVAADGVDLFRRNGILPALHAGDRQSHSNFVNPGIRMIGIGADADLLPELRVSLNWNYFLFDQTQVLAGLRQSEKIDNVLGQDVSVSLTWRPFMTQNLALRLSAAGLFAGSGFDDLYGSDANTPYSILGNLVLVY